MVLHSLAWWIAGGAALALLYTYVLFPGWMIWLGKRRQAPQPNPVAELPPVVVVLAAYNEARVIAEKVHRTFASHYPTDKLRMVVGTDCCSDATDAILHELAATYTGLTVVPFGTRTGKPQIVNHLVEHYTSPEDILVLTDADTFFHPETLPALIAPLSEAQVGGVQAYIFSRSDRAGHIGSTEVAFNHWDLAIKRGESRFGAVIGALGACYALRRVAYTPVPRGFINDDLFIFLHALNAGWDCVVAPAAHCEMDVSAESRVQFRRKVRIGQGSFQILRHYAGWMAPWRKAGFFLLSHKVLRWCTPLLLLVLLGAGLTLWAPRFHPLHLAVAAALGLLLWAIRPLRHFLQMNAALLVGMWRAFTQESDGTWSNR